MKMKVVIERLEEGERVIYVAYPVPRYAVGYGLTSDSALANLRANLQAELDDEGQITARHEIVTMEA